MSSNVLQFVVKIDVLVGLVISSSEIFNGRLTVGVGTQVVVFELLSKIE